MDSQDRQAIEGLFDRLGEAERQAPPPDTAANNLIKERIARQPMSPYFMAQTIVIQEMALQDAQARIDELERAQARPPAGSGGFLSGMFGGARPTASVPPVPRAAPPSSFAQPPQAGRGGFMAGAAQTAMGVAGGVLLGNAIGSMLGGDEAKAAAPAEAAPAETPAPENTSNEGGGGFFDNFLGGDDDEAA